MVSHLSYIFSYYLSFLNDSWIFLFAPLWGHIRKKCYVCVSYSHAVQLRWIHFFLNTSVIAHYVDFLLILSRGSEVPNMIVKGRDGLNQLVTSIPACHSYISFFVNFIFIVHSISIVFENVNWISMGSDSVVRVWLLYLFLSFSH